MTVILPSEEGFPGVSRRSRISRTPSVPAGVGTQDYGASLVQPIAPVREAAEQCRVDCSLHDATRAFDDFTQALTTDDTDFDKWPARFTAEAKRLRDRFAADIPDGSSRDRFDAGFDLFAKAKAVETRGLATHKRIATNRSELDRTLAGYGETISRAMNPVSVDFALKQGEEAIRNQVGAQVLSEHEGRDLSRRYRADIATRRAEQFTLDDPAEAAKELGKAKGGLFSDLDRDQRRRLAAQAEQTAAAQAADADRMATAEERQMLAEKSLRRDAFLRDLDDRTEKGAATLTDITAAARDGVLDADDATDRMKSLKSTFVERDLQAERVTTVMRQSDTFLDPEDADDRRAADIHWRDAVLPMVKNLPETERVRFEDAVVLNTGIAPKPVVDGVLAGLLSAEPAPRVAAARRVHKWLLTQPPIPVDRHGLRIPEFETLRPYLDLPLSDARMVKLAERNAGRNAGRNIEREEIFTGGFRAPKPLGPARDDGPIELVDVDSTEAGEGPSSGEAAPEPDAGGDAGPEPSSPAEAQERFDEKLADPETRAALRDQLLNDLEAEAERSNLSPAEVLERQQEIRDALPADPEKGTQVAIAPVIAAGAAGAGSASGISSAIASALAVIGLGGLLKGDTNDAGNATQDGVSKRVEEDDSGGRERGGDSPPDGTSAGDPGDEPPDRERPGRKASDSSKNERHGDGGRAARALEKKLEEERAIEAAKKLPKKERQRALQTIKNRRYTADKKRRGESHKQKGQRGKGQR